ncbi:MAG: hypothetical protein ACFE0Q_00215 [Anaerolineae bacterium]
MSYLKKKSWRIVLMFAVGAFFLLWVGNPNPQDQRQPHSDAPTVSDLLHSYSADERANLPDDLMSYRDMGTIGVLFGDAEGLVGDGDMLTYFTNDEGAMMPVATRTDTEFLAYNGDTVAIEYLQAPDPVPGDSFFPEIYINEITVAQDDDAQNGVFGNTRWMNIACRFGDMGDVTPRPIDYFESILVNEAPGMDDYWRTTSADLVNIEGSHAYGWYDLPRSKAEYLRMAAVNTGNALQTLMNDCTQVVREADGVDFSQFGGINMMLNDTFGCCAWGGRMTLRIDGQNMQFRTTWLPPWAFNSLHVIAHEMGHGWGLPHSSGPYGKVYDSAWDVMSGGNSNHTDAICRVGSEPLGCWQVGTIGFHLAMLGWIPEERMAVVPNGQSATIEIDPLTTLGTSDGTMVIFLPIGNSNRFYTVEARAFIDYDRNLPGEAVILHEVVPGRPSPAHVVDADNNGNPNDEGAMWRVGETFEDRRNNIRVEVLENNGNTVTVRISNGG